MLMFLNKGQGQKRGHDISGPGIEEADPRVRPRVPVSGRPISLSQTADPLFSPDGPTFEQLLQGMMRKHQSDIEDLFYRFLITEESPEQRKDSSNNSVAGSERSKAESPAQRSTMSNASLPVELAEQSCVGTDFSGVPKDFESGSTGEKSKATKVSYVPRWQSTRKTRWEMAQVLVWNFLEQPDGGLSNQIFHSLSNVLIALSVASPVMYTAQISEDAKSFLNYADIVFTMLFTIELATKLISCPDKLVFIKSLYSLIDFAVVFAGFLGIFASVESIWLDLISTQVPILRLLKITRHSSGWRLLMMSMKNCINPLLVPLYLMLLMIVFTGSLHYWIDNVLGCTAHDCPDEQKPAFKSIPHAMWFVLVSLSTVGYGDITPHTDVGKILACFQIVAGLCYMAMPLAIIGNNFSEIWNDRHRILLKDKLTNSAIKRDIKDVKKLFYSFDDDKSGTITLDEFLPFVESLEMGLSRRVIHDLFRSIDLDGSGIISFSEFADFVFPDAQEEDIAD